MKRFGILLFFLFLACGVFSQSVVRGIVTDNVGRPINAALVYALQSKTSTLTNNHGYFELNIAGVKDSVEISYVGYQPQIFAVSAPTRSVARFMLENDKSVDIDMVVVSGCPTPMSFTNTTLCDAEVSAANVSQDIPFLLEDMQSVVATSETGTGIGYTSMRIRGTDMSRINVTLNGVPLNDAESQDVFFVDFGDLSSTLGKIDVQRGVGTSTNGTASFGGSINFETKENSLEPAFQFTGVVGSFGTRKIAVAASTPLIDSTLTLGINFSRLRSDGYIQRSKSSIQSFDANLSFMHKKHKLSALFFYGDEITGITWNGLPAEMYDVDPTYNIAGRYYDDDGNECFYENETDNYIQKRGILSYEYGHSQPFSFNCSLFWTNGNGYYEQYHDDASLADYGFSNAIHDIVCDEGMDNNFYGYIANLIYKKKKIDFTLGHSYSIYDGNHYGYVLWIQDDGTTDLSQPYYRHSGLKKDLNVFGKLNYVINSQLNTYADLQYRNISYNIEGSDYDLSDLDVECNWNFWNPKFGLVYKLPAKQTLSASFAVANREPTKTNITEYLKQEQTRELHHETLYDIEIGYRKVWKKLLFTANLYSMKYDNQLVQTGKLNFIGYSLMENVKDSYRRGLECSFDYRPVKEIEWGGNVTFSCNKIRDYVEYAQEYDELGNELQKEIKLGTTDISYSPNFVASHKIIVFPTEGLSIGIVSKLVGEQYFDNTSSDDRKIKRYVVHDFQARYVWKVGETSSLDFQFLINNLLDKKYISNAYGGNWYEQGTEYTWKYYFPQAGINYTLKATYTF